MLTREQNELLTTTGPGTPGGNLLRRYWQPVALSEELPRGGAPLSIRILGEDLVLFRDEVGRPGILALHCSHRGADLSYGRIEDGGLRCIYHGWLYDIRGNCLEQPGEPLGSDFHNKIRHAAYPCQEVAGLVFTYMGPGEPPLLPMYEPLTVPDEYRSYWKIIQDCNYLQANEGNMDPAHLSFLHRLLPSHPSYKRGPDLSVRGTDRSPSSLYAGDLSPTIEMEETDFGVRILAIRRVGAEQGYLRVSNFIMPNASTVPTGVGADGYSLSWFVPIDDTHHARFSLSFRRSAPLDHVEFRSRATGEQTPDYRWVRNKSNRYLQDREEMKTKTFSGMGDFFPAHDAYATVSPGPIQDRTQEHLGTTDKAIISQRQMLLQAIRDVENGRDPLHVIRDPVANHFPHVVVQSEVISASEDWRTLWQSRVTDTETAASMR